jgi:hypothetical protein
MSSAFASTHPRIAAVEARGGQLAEIVLRSTGQSFTRSGEEIRGNVPWRPGSDSGALAVNSKTGQWYDHARDDDGGPLALLARVEGLPTEGPEFMTRTVARAEQLLGITNRTNRRDPLADWAAHRGFALGALLALGAVPHGNKGEAIRIPMRDAAGAVVGSRLRRADGTPFSCGAKAITKGGGKLGIIHAPTRATAPGGKVYLVEGETDLLALLTRWPLAVAFATPGATVSKPCLGYLEQLLRASGAAEAIACADNDEAGAVWLAKMQAACKAAGVAFRAWRPPAGVKDLDEALKMRKDAPPMDAPTETTTSAPPAAEDPAAVLVELGTIATPAEAEATATPTKAEGWGAVVPFEDEEPAPFPLAALEVAPVLHRFVAEVSRSSQTPPDLAALAALSILGAAGAKVFRVAIKRGHHTEPLNIWTCTALPPGARKSGVHKVARLPVERAEEILGLETAPERAELQANKGVLEGRIKLLTQKAAKEKDPAKRREISKEIAKLERELKGLKANLDPPRLFGADANQEGITRGLVAGGGRFLLEEVEGTALETLAGRFNDGNPAFEAVLKAHDGDPIRVDRLARTVNIALPALSMALAVQPDVLRSIATKRAFRGRGFLGRILFAWPRPITGRIAFPEPPSTQALEEYTDAVCKLFLKPLPTREDIINPTPAASQVWEQFFNEIEPRHGEGGDLESIADWVSKLCGRVARIAGILHLAIHGPRAHCHLLEAKTMEAAVSLGRYFLAHACLTFQAMGSNANVVEDAKHLWRWIKARKLPVVPWGVAWKGTKGRMQTAEALAAAFGELTDRGHLRELPAERPPTGRPPRPSYAVNPELLK